MKELFNNQKSGLTVGALRKILSSYDDNLPVCVKILTHNFPAVGVQRGTFEIYGFKGVVKEIKDGLIIE